MSAVKMALIQMKMEADPARNLATATSCVRAAAARGAQIIALPELFTTLYFPQESKKEVAHLAESIPGPTIEKLSALARELSIVLIAGSLFERHGDRCYNTSVVLDDRGAIASTYRKMHIPHDPCFYEADYFSRGDKGYTVATTRFGRIATLICYDQWYPEAARCAALAGADIIFYPTAIGNVDDIPQTEGNWQEAWMTVQRGHAIANCVFVAAVNRVGREGKVNFWGGSFVASPFGAIIAQSGSDEEILLASGELEQGRDIMEYWGFFRNRRPDTYDRLVRR